MAFGRNYQKYETSRQRVKPQHMYVTYERIFGNMLIIIRLQPVNVWSHTYCFYLHFGRKLSQIARCRCQGRDGIFFLNLHALFEQDSQKVPAFLYFDRTIRPMYKWASLSQHQIDHWSLIYGRARRCECAAGQCCWSAKRPVSGLSTSSQHSKTRWPSRHVMWSTE